MCATLARKSGSEGRTWLGRRLMGCGWRGPSRGSYGDSRGALHVRELPLTAGCRSRGSRRKERTVGQRVVSVLAAVVVAAGGASSVLACVVGTGTSASCTEDALTACLIGGGTVTFDCGGNATIATTTTKTINLDTTIDASASIGAITISGGGTAGIFFAIAPFTVKNLTISDYSGFGAAIVQSSSFPTPVTVMNSGISNNTIGIDNFGTLTVTNSQFSQNGGGISTISATVIVDNVTFGGNGTAINSGGMVTVTNSTFGSNNGASGTGGNGAAINSSG